MGTGSVENLVLKWLGRLPTVPVPFFGRAIGKHREKRGQAPRGSGFRENSTCLGLGASPLFSLPLTVSALTIPKIRVAVNRQDDRRLA